MVLNFSPNPEARGAYRDGAYKKRMLQSYKSYIKSVNKIEQMDESFFRVTSRLRSQIFFLSVSKPHTRACGQICETLKGLNISADDSWCKNVAIKTRKTTLKLLLLELLQEENK